MKEGEGKLSRAEDMKGNECHSVSFISFFISASIMQKEIICHVSYVTWRWAGNGSNGLSMDRKKLEIRKKGKMGKEIHV